MTGIATKLDNAAKSTAHLLVDLLAVMLSFIRIWIAIGAVVVAAELLIGTPLLEKLWTIPLLIGAVFSNRVTANAGKLLIEITDNGNINLNQ
jgi:hypothetical protein